MTTCNLCSDRVEVRDQRDHLIEHSPASNCAIDDPGEFFTEGEEEEEGTTDENLSGNMEVHCRS